MQTLALQDCMLEHKDYYKDFIGLADNVEGEKTYLQSQHANKSLLLSKASSCLPTTDLHRSFTQEQQAPLTFLAAARQLKLAPCSANCTAVESRGAL